jgi:hypothetical protein
MDMERTGNNVENGTTRRCEVFVYVTGPASSDNKY